MSDPSQETRPTQEGRGKKFLSGIAGITTLLVFLYITISSALIPYYNWQYASTHGYVKWLFLGEVVATAQAFVWPYYVFFDSTDRKKVLKAYIAADEYAREGTTIIKSQVKGTLVVELPISAFDSAIELYKLALGESKKVDRDVMNDFYPSFGDHFESKFVHGLELIVSGYERDELELMNQGQRLFNQWKDWYNANRDDIANWDGMGARIRG